MGIRRTVIQSLFIIPLVFGLGGACANDIKGDPGTDAATRKAVYNQPTSDTTQVIIPASELQPSTAIIGESTYTNTADVVCELTRTGRNGRDEGELEGGKIYYLYAIPPESGSSFDSIASTKGPKVGPAEFPSWSYLGAFRVGIGKDVTPFTHVGDGIIYNSYIPFYETTTTEADYVQILPNVESIDYGFDEILPSTATLLHIETYASVIENGGGTPIGRGAFVFSVDGLSIFHEAAAWSEVPPGAGMLAIDSFLLPLSPDGSFFYKITGPDGVETRITYTFFVTGFLEFPQLWP